MADQQTLEGLLAAPSATETQTALRQQQQAAFQGADVGARAGMLAERITGGLFGKPVDPAVERAKQRDEFRNSFLNTVREQKLSVATDPGGFYTAMSDAALASGQYEIATLAAQRARDAKLSKTEETLASAQRLAAEEKAQAQSILERTRAEASAAEARQEQQQRGLLERLRALQEKQTIKKAVPIAQPTDYQLKQIESLLADRMQEFAPHGTQKGRIVERGNARRNANRDAYVTDVGSRAAALMAEAKARGEIMEWSAAVLQADQELSPNIQTDTAGFGPFEHPAGRYTPTQRGGTAGAAAGTRSNPIILATPEAYSTVKSGEYFIPPGETTPRVKR